MILNLTPATSKPDYPLNVEMCAQWLVHLARWKVQSNLRVIRRVAEMDDSVIFVSGDRKFTANEILDLIDQDGRLTGEDPRPRE